MLSTYELAMALQNWAISRATSRLWDVAIPSQYGGPDLVRQVGATTLREMLPAASAKAGIDLTLVVQWLNGLPLPGKNPDRHSCGKVISRKVLSLTGASIFGEPEGYKKGAILIELNEDATELPVYQGDFWHEEGKTGPLSALKKGDHVWTWDHMPKLSMI